MGWPSLRFLYAPFIWKACRATWLLTVGVPEVQGTCVSCMPCLSDFQYRYQLKKFAIRPPIRMRAIRRRVGFVVQVDG
jgi:hypothetical protein